MNPERLQPKPRYEILDGLRGVAALLVVAFHLLETYSGGACTQVINHGYLAVDFFFVLSGFVIGYAYDDRWDRGMSVRTFFMRRLIRLHPMLVFGTLLGALLFYFTDAGFELVARTPWWVLLCTTLICMTLLPLPVGMDIRGWAEFNPLNGPTWSLLWEYVGNICYALFVRRWSTAVLAAVVVLCGAMTVTLCLNLDLFGLLTQREGTAFTVIGGWCMTPEQLYIGATRLAYPFLAGLLLFRLGYRVKVKRHAFAWCSLLVAAVLLCPRVGGVERADWWMNGLYEAVCIIVLFPLVVSMGAGGTIGSGKELKIMRFLGEISYPLYVTHYPLVYLHMSWAATHRDAPASTHAMAAASLYLLAVAVAYASSKLYDLPVRDWLKRRLKA